MEKKVVDMGRLIAELQAQGTDTTRLEQCVATIREGWAQLGAATENEQRSESI